MWPRIIEARTRMTRARTMARVTALSGKTVGARCTDAFPLLQGSGWKCRSSSAAAAVGNSGSALFSLVELEFNCACMRGIILMTSG